MGGKETSCPSKKIHREKKARGKSKKRSREKIMNQEEIERRKRKILKLLNDPHYMSYNSYQKDGKRRE